MDKIHSLFEDLQKAHSKLSIALELPESEINQDASIQRFEFTFELVWKLMNMIVRQNGIESYGPKNTIREATKMGLIESIDDWFDFLNARNLTTHTYNKETADKVYESAKEFEKAVEELIEKIPSFLEK